MELMVGATYDNIMMVEGEMDEVSETDLLNALKAAHEAIRTQCKAQIELAEAVGRAKREYCHEVNDEELRKDVHDKCYAKAYAIAQGLSSADKHWRQDSFDAICKEYIESLPEEERDEKTPLVKRYYHDVEREAVRRCILDEGVRLDGRKTTDIRPIWCEVDYIPGLTVQPCSHVVRHSRSPLSHSAPSSTRRSSTTCSTRVTSVSSSTTTSSLLNRRGQAAARRRTPRDRPRQSRPPRAQAHVPRRIPLLLPYRQRHP